MPSYSSSPSLVHFSGTTLAWLLASLLPVGGIFALAAYALSLPLRRQERARFFLDLLETGLRQGRSPESTLIGISQCHEPSVGPHFHWLASYLQSGLGFSQALEKLPGWLPPPLVAMLKAGERTGNLAQVLPACRQFLRDGLSQFIKVQNYMMLLPFLATPIILMLLVPLFSINVFPRLLEIMKDMEIQPPAFAIFFAAHPLLVVTLEGVILAVAVVFVISTVFYVGGARFLVWAFAGLPWFGDWLFQRIPWRRKRMQRDFSAVLALLLDAEVPEAEAVSLAATCANNRVFVQQAASAVNDLRQGAGLGEAMRHVDEAAEFRWRLANAGRSRQGFWTALAGWREALDAKACQQEQAFAQVATAALVLGNGCLVCLIALAVFQPLVAVINGVALW